MTYAIGDIFKNDDDYENKAKWARENNAKISFYEDKLEDIEKTRQVEIYEEQELIIPAEYDKDGTLIKEETTEIVQMPVTKEETYTEQEIVRYYQLVARPEPNLDELKAQKREERDRILQSTDIYMLPDYPISDEERGLYKQYRQYLRDLPTTENFPEVDVLTFEQWGGDNNGVQGQKTEVVDFID